MRDQPSFFKRLIPLALACMTAMAAMGILFPLLPFQAKIQGATPDKVPLVFACYAVGAFLCAPLWGAFSDKFQRKPALYACLLISSGAYLYLARADSLVDIYWALFLTGCSAGWISIFHALASDVTEPKERTRAMGVIGASLGGGVLVGVATGGLINLILSAPDQATQVYSTAFTVSSILCLLSLLICLRIPKIPSSHSTRRPALSSFLRFRWTSWRLILIYLIGLSAFSGLESTFATWANEHFNAGPALVSVALIISGIVAVCTQGIIVGIAARKVGEKHLLMFAVGFLALSYIGLAFASNAWIAVIVLSLIGMAMGLHNPCLKSWSSRICSSGSRGSIQSALQSSSSLARILGPLLAHGVFKLADIYDVGYGVLYIVTAFLLIPAFILLSTLAPLRHDGEGEHKRRQENIDPS